MGNTLPEVTQLLLSVALHFALDCLPVDNQKNTQPSQTQVCITSEPVKTTGVCLHRAHTTTDGE